MYNWHENERFQPRNAQHDTSILFNDDQTSTFLEIFQPYFAQHIISLNIFYYSFAKKLIDNYRLMMLVKLRINEN